MSHTTSIFHACLSNVLNFKPKMTLFPFIAKHTMHFTWLASPKLILNIYAHESCVAQIFLHLRETSWTFFGFFGCDLGLFLSFGKIKILDTWGMVGRTKMGKPLECTNCIVGLLWFGFEFSSTLCLVFKLASKDDVIWNSCGSLGFQLDLN